MDVSATDNHNIGIRLPRTAIRTLLQPFPALHGRVLRGTAARLVADHMTSLWRHASEVSSGDVSLILNATASIVAGCLAERDAQPTPPFRSSGRSFAVWQSVMRYVDLHLADVKLGTISICTALGLSRASLYRALTGDGGVASYILGRRLDTIHAAIVDAAQARTLADLAFATGFTSYSHFSAAFRNRFGHSPRQAQRTALAVGLGRNGSVDGIRDAYGSWLRGLRCGTSAADQVSISLNQQAT